MSDNRPETYVHRVFGPHISDLKFNPKSDMHGKYQ